jgi:hypothetical protein
MEVRILRTEKDVENSCLVLETEQGQEWISCAECRVGEVACDYLKSKWEVDPCLFRKGVRLGRGLEPDPRDVVQIIQNNVAVYVNMLEKQGPLLKAEKLMLEKVMTLENEQLEKARSMLYGGKLK